MSATQVVTVTEEPAASASVGTASNELEKRKLGERLADTVRRFWDLGFTSFGGPGVHVVILR